MRKAIGIVETYGLLAGVAVADEMVKGADVVLLGYEFARGQGMTSVKVEGDVGAVQASVACGIATAKRMNLFRSSVVIPRPADGLDMMISNDMTVLRTDPIETKQEKTLPSETKPEKAKKKDTLDQDICNLCGDPKCPRRPGQRHILCIHFNDE